MSGFIAHILLSDNQLCIVYEDKRVLPVCVYNVRRIEGFFFVFNE